jgi:hypothetical protein
MKLFLLITMVLFFSKAELHSQVLVLDSTVAGILTATGIDKLIQYGYMVSNTAAQVRETINLIENTGTMINRAVQNLGSLRDVESFSDFMDWYNRQLYFERMAGQAWGNTRVTIGNNQYHLMDIEGMAHGFSETFIDYWDNEFTDAQRRAMWLNLGLTPANYAYVLPFRQRHREVTNKFFVSGQVNNERYMEDMIRNNRNQSKLANDDSLNLEDKMGDKEVAMIIAETSIANNIALRDLTMLMSDYLEFVSLEVYMRNMPSVQRTISDRPENGFRPLRR